MSVDKEYEQLSDQEVCTAITQLVLDGSMDVFRGCDLDNDTIERWCVRAMIIREATPVHIEPTLFKVGDAPREIKATPEKKQVYYKSKKQLLKEEKDRLARILSQEKQRKNIKRCITEQVQKEEELLQPKRPAEFWCGLSDEDLHVIDPQSEQIIRVAFRDFEINCRTRWRHLAFNQIFSHNYITNKQLQEARKLY